MIRRLFSEHPQSLGMSWAEHGGGAARMGLKMVAGGMACLIHALIPGLFVRTTSRLVDELHSTTHKRNALYQHDYEI